MGDKLEKKKREGMKEDEEGKRAGWGEGGGKGTEAGG